MLKVNKYFITYVLILTFFIPAMASELMIADFNKGYPPNLLAGEIFTFGHLASESWCASSFSSKNLKGKGKSCRIEFEVHPGGGAGWGMSLEGKDISRYKYLSFWIKGKAVYGDFRLMLRDKNFVTETVNLSRFVTLNKKWQKVVIPFKAYRKIDYVAMDSIVILFDERNKKGTIYVDDFKIIVSYAEKKDKIVNIDAENIAPDISSIVKADQLLIDGFERRRPHALYRSVSTPEASVTLRPSGEAYEKKHSLAIDYRFTGSKRQSVKAVYNADVPLDWSGVRQVILWVKGDGSGNIFRLNLYDGSGEIWAYEDRYIMGKDGWNMLTVLMSDFFLSRDSLLNNEIFDTDKICGFEFEIIRRSASSAVLGTVCLDKFSVAGKNINALNSLPRRLLSIQ